MSECIAQWNDDARQASHSKSSSCIETNKHQTSLIFSKSLSCYVYKWPIWYNSEAESPYSRIGRLSCYVYKWPIWYNSEAESPYSRIGQRRVQLTLTTIFCHNQYSISIKFEQQNGMDNLMQIFSSVKKDDLSIKRGRFIKNLYSVMANICCIILQSW